MFKYTNYTQGLYAEKHGVLANDLYDLKLKKYITYGYELFHYSNSTLPIWVSYFILYFFSIDFISFEKKKLFRCTL